MNKYKKFASDTILFIISNFASKLLVFVMLPFYTNILSTEEYAIADLIATTLNLVFPIMTLSITEAVLRFAFDHDVKRNEALSAAMLFILGSTIILIPCAPLVARFSTTLAQYWGFFIISYLATALQTCFSNFTRGCDQTKIFALQGIVHAIVLVACNLLFLLVFKAQLNGYLISIILANCSSVIFMVVFGHHFKELLHFRLNKSLLKAMLRYSVPMIPTIVAWWVMQTSDKYIIIAKLGLSESGIYSVAYKIPSILSIVASLAAQAWQISAIKNYNEDDNERFVGTVYNYYNIVNVIACAGLILITKPLSYFLYLKDYFSAWRYVPYLLVAYLFSGLSGMLASVFTASKKTEYLLISTTVGAVLNIVLNFFAVEQFGAIGAAYTTLFGFAVTWCIRYFVAKRLLNFKVPLLKHTLLYILLIADAICISSDIPCSEILSALLLVIMVLMQWKEIHFFVQKVFAKILKRKA